MNTNTRQIEMTTAFEAATRKEMVMIDNKEMTLKQAREMQVSLHDHRSVLGQKLTAIRRAERSKYPTPHMGAKEQAKLERRAANKEENDTMEAPNA